MPANDADKARLAKSGGVDDGGVGVAAKGRLNMGASRSSPVVRFFFVAFKSIASSEFHRNKGNKRKHVKNEDNKP
ncbi:hypothetical protein [Paenibacillus xanthanilyticus]|uniref:Uncharacterized protein n=1 Tax=Paenibacillus xanthanilyticus TaxID=1783531 RepID=A0ABV8K479_9BACL